VPFTDHGDGRCTQTFQMPGQTGPGRAAPDTLLCRRVEPELTVSVQAIGRNQDDVRVAAGVEDV
jgi:hypothetical protein